MSSPSNDYRMMVEAYSANIEELVCSAQHWQRVVLRQKKAALVHLALFQQMYDAIVVPDKPDTELAAAILKDFFEPPPNGVN